MKGFELLLNFSTPSKLLFMKVVTTFMWATSFDQRFLLILNSKKYILENHCCFLLFRIWINLQIMLWCHHEGHISFWNPAKMLLKNRSNKFTKLEHNEPPSPNLPQLLPGCRKQEEAKKLGKFFFLNSFLNFLNFGNFLINLI